MAGLLLPDLRFRSPTAIPAVSNIAPFTKRWIVHTDHPFTWAPGVDMSLHYIAVEPFALYETWDQAQVRGVLPRRSLGKLIIEAEKGRIQFESDLLNLMDAFTGIGSPAPLATGDAIAEAVNQVVKHLSARSDVSEIGSFFADLMARYSKGTGHLKLKPPLLCARSESLKIRIADCPAQGELAVVVRGMEKRDVR